MGKMCGFLRSAWKLFERGWEAVHWIALIVILLMVIIAIVHGLFKGSGF